MSTTPIVRTVLGDIQPEALGACDAHEHLLLRSPLLAGEELEDVELVSAEGRLLAEAGAASVVDWTPVGLGRAPAGLQAISRWSGLHVVAATGYHRDAHYRRDHWVWREPVDVLTTIVLRDLGQGIDARDWSGPEPRATDVRAGLVKLGGSLHRVTPLEQKLIEAGATAAAQTGVPVAVHTEHGTHAAELLDVLERHGVPPQRVILAHLDRNPDPGLHREVAASGATLEYDGPGRAKYHPDSTILGLIASLAEAGLGDRVVVGGDTARRSALRSAGGGPGLDYVFRVFRPRLARELGADLDRQVFVTNPARAFSFAPRS
jgi:predicted metal-dependent phosphotriesterase family hydrolase